MRRPAAGIRRGRPGAHGPDDDVAQHLSSRRLRRLSAEELQELRRILRTDERQTHARDVLRQRSPAEPLAGTAPAPQGDDLATRHELYAQLWGFVDPLS